MSDLGPLTTEFAAPATCTASTPQIYQIWQELTTYQYVQGPLWTTSSTNCFPSSYEPTPTAYFSPGYCPHGYTPACSSIDSSATLAETAFTCCPTGLDYTCAADGATLGCTTSFTSALVAIGATVVKNGKQAGVTTVSETKGGIAAYSIAVRIRETDPPTPAAGPSTSSTAQSSTIDNSSPFTIIAPSSTQSASSGGISTGEAIGIGLGSAGFVIALLVGFGIWYYMRWRRRKLEAQVQRRSARLNRPGAPPIEHFSFKGDESSQQHHYVFPREPPSPPAFASSGVASPFSYTKSPHESGAGSPFKYEYVAPPQQGPGSPPPSDQGQYDYKHNYAMGQFKLPTSDAHQAHAAPQVVTPYDFTRQSSKQSRGGGGESFQGTLDETGTVRYELPPEDTSTQYLDPLVRRETIMSTSTYSTAHDRTSPAGSVDPFAPPLPVPVFEKPDPSTLLPIMGAQPPHHLPQHPYMQHSQELHELQQPPPPPPPPPPPQQQRNSITRALTGPARTGPWPLQQSPPLPQLPSSPPLGAPRRSMTQPPPGPARLRTGDGLARQQAAAYRPAELEGAPMASPSGTGPGRVGGSAPSRVGSPGMSHGTMSFQSDGTWRTYGDATVAPAAWL